jgi:formate dehydrogenase assembly factor FdhD
MVQKAAMCGVEILFAVSAATTWRWKSPSAAT